MKLGRLLTATLCTLGTIAKLDELMLFAHPDCYILFSITIANKLEWLVGLLLTWWRKCSGCATVSGQLLMSVVSLFSKLCFLSNAWVKETRYFGYSILTNLRIFVGCGGDFQILLVVEIPLLVSRLVTVLWNCSSNTKICNSLDCVGVSTFWKHFWENFGNIIIR